MNETTTAFADDEPWDLPGYDILSLDGQGPFYSLYRARQRSLDRIVAVRTRRGEGERQEVAESLLRVEARFLTRLQHPYVLSILDLFEHAGQVYLVLPYLGGGTLAAKIAGQQQPPRLTATLVERLARTLAYVHQCGIVHCNLQPREVLLANPPAAERTGTAALLDHEDVYGLPIIGDFGLAVDSQRLAELPAEAVRGTPAYMAPEQAGGRLQDISAATDIHGLGTILYEMLAGRRPFGVQTASVNELLTHVQSREPQPVQELNPGIDPKLAAICHRCLRKDPAARYASALGLADDLRNYIAANVTGG